MMITQRDIQEQALRWFVVLRDEDAPDSAWTAFQDWLEADEAHRLAYDAVERVWVDLDEAPGPVAANDAGRDARPARDLSSPRRRTGLNWLYPSVAAAAALVLAVGVWLHADRPVPETVYRTDAASRTVVLADGSRVALNRHSELGVRITDGARRLRLDEGEAAFDVVHDPDRPFVVEAGPHRVEVLGTAFNVLNHGRRFQVSVERGVVAVTPAEARRPVRLIAGQRIDQTDAAQPVLSQVDPARASAWREGVLVYRNNTLDVVADDLSRYFDKPVTLSPSARALHFTGVLQTGDEATMLKQLQDFVPIRVDRSATGIHLTTREEG